MKAHAPLPLRTILAFTLLAFAAIVRAAPVDDNPPPGWWRDATFYEIFVRSFADSRSGPLANDGVGDLQGLIDHLDYLNDGRGAESSSLGVNALWLMPIQPSPSYHGYDVTDYFAVNPQYGDIATMKKLVAEAHRRGIRVIIDLVLNHCSDQHPLFLAAKSGDPARDAKARAMFRFAPVPENITGPYGQRVWHPANDDFYYGIFSSQMPDWNFRNPAVTEHHRKAAAFWLRDIGVDGFRLDAVRYFYEDGDEMQDTPETQQWLHDFTAYCHSIKPGAFVVGENTSNMREVSQYIRGGALDSAFEFDLAKATVESMQLQSGALLSQTIDRLMRLYADDSAWSTFLSNHDQDRIMSQLHRDPKRARFAAELLFTLPGVPFVYYGEEIGMTGTKPDPEIRTPMPWNAEAPNAGFTTSAAKAWHPITGDFRMMNVATESHDPQSLLALYHRLIRLNAASPALRHGHPIELQSDDRKVMAVMRESDNDAVLVLANFALTARDCPPLSIAHSGIQPSWSCREELENVPIASPTISTTGSFANWIPLRHLAPNAVYVVRWTKP